MSRIDEALRRLRGLPTPENRSAASLERFDCEAAAPLGIVDAPRPVEEVKVARFSPAALRPVERVPHPPTPPPAPARVVESDPNDEPLIDLGPIVDYLRYGSRSIRRHWLLTLGISAAIVVTTAGVLKILPRTYYVDTKLLAQRNAVMTALSNPSRTVPWDADAPTRAAAETVLRRDNLISLALKTDLIREFERNLAPFPRFRHWFNQTVLGHTETADEKLDAVVALLEKNMRVDAGPIGDGTVTISLYWPNGEMAYRLVQEAQQAFLEARQVAETTAIAESINVLERYSGSLHEDVKRTMLELKRATAAADATTARPRRRVTQPVVASPLVATATPQPAPPSLEFDPELVRLRTALTAKRQELGRIQQARQQQVVDLQNRLAQLKTVFTSNHPTVMGVQQNLDALRDNPQASLLANEIEELQAEYDTQMRAVTEKQVKAFAAAAAPTVPPPAPRELPVAPRYVVEEPAPAVASPDMSQSQFATLRLRSELNQLESVLARTDAARIELAVSQAAFKYRYTVIRPALVPKSPAFPRARLILATSIVAGFLLAIMLVVLKDFLSNRIFEAWQVERRLGLPVFGTLRRA
jgi:uncharacterized protein involved in exopolysaccharide biosynthesis